MMSFSLLTPAAIVLFVVAGVTAVMVLGVAVDFFVRHHAARVSRHESIPAYYGNLLGAH